MSVSTLRYYNCMQVEFRFPCNVSILMVKCELLKDVVVAFQGLLVSVPRAKLGWSCSSFICLHV